ncbi:hypothetical protein HBH56_042110 [Parastagonospora nodorum]|uniref:DUF7730 domain-containing protein n=2 Tax=Phaeosphaeria nodorum (strain SN15 / ATCC MYA-4574 / FGSC 10173) TaxID=321614 RepID=A0A7U2HV31_PHANO|nr:hypothetical protein SNOG_08000 [Parastagonospora nodorum SN15]KAH3917567.1 hypothetical protein HBH56_042110 [Parastagonospora nodorum]EAT84276.1 hypothetical protein SNOG_08000 [Parastagonospora nodorum SN15]KAH3933265.1 hypothetical protein HBH54_069860 [Parastagonospora nodorum]KAH3943481.1 hypothetical protein HBH53_174030 [Parastagonospora nodorum]KAH4004145.1 hypothetical protein HBI10_048900 [Parastagonospora nodorum]
MAQNFSAMLPLQPLWYPCRDMTCCCNIDKCMHCKEIMMALRKNPQRCCQEIMMPPVASTKFLPITIEIKEATVVKKKRQLPPQRRTKRYVADAQRHKRRTSLAQLPRPTNDKPFPFFKLPRELRDQVYASLVTRTDCRRSVISAVSLLSDKKAKRAAQAKRERLNRRRILDGKSPARTRDSESEPIVYLKLLQSSRRLYDEAQDYLYSNNWFALTLDKLPSTTFETPYGWNLSSITRLQIEIQLKDAAHMNSYVDWTAFFSSFTSLRFLHVAPTFHPRYYDWAYPELSNWTAAHYVHRAFFRELLAAIPSHVNINFGDITDGNTDLQLQGQAICQTVVASMYAELGRR